MRYLEDLVSEITCVNVPRPRPNTWWLLSKRKVNYIQAVYIMCPCLISPLVCGHSENRNYKRKLSAIRRMNVYQQDRYSLQSICPTSTHTFCHLILWKMATCNYSSYRKKCIHSSPKGAKPEVLSVIVSMWKFRVFRWHPFFL